MNYKEFSELPRSVKTVLAHIDCRQLVKLFTEDSPGVWTRQSDLFVVGVQINGSELPLEDFSYSPATKTLSISRSTDPGTETVTLTYRLFLSDRPQNLPFDLSDGEEVEYLPLITSIGELKLALDFEQTGVALETNSSIVIENTDGFFDDKFDQLIFENQRCAFYSWGPAIPLSEAKLLYRGRVREKSFTDNSVRLSLVDDIFQLRKPVDTGRFSLGDGRLSPSDIDRPKPRVYGQARTMRTTGTDKILDGYPLGQISGNIGDVVITGTDFFTKLLQDDRIILTVDGQQVELTILAVVSNSVATVTTVLPAQIINEYATVRPARPARLLNRRWHIAGHRLSEIEAEVTQVISSSRFAVSTVDGIMPGNVFRFGPQSRVVSRVSGNQIILTQGFSPAPIVGDILSRSPIVEAFLGESLLVPGRDYTYENGPDAVLVLDPLAEFNVSPVLGTSFNMTFTASSTEVTTTADVDLKTLFGPGDWIISADISHQVWYEITNVVEKKLDLRSPYAGPTVTNQPRRRSPQVADDRSLVTVSCYGLERDGKWIRTPADCVLDLIKNDSGLDGINEQSFATASKVSPATVSLIIRTQDRIRDVIGKINATCFGSLFQDINFNISYSVLNGDLPSGTRIFRDDDILDFSVKTTNQIAGRVDATFGPYVDTQTGRDSVGTVSEVSDFVAATSAIGQVRQLELALFSGSDAETVSQRSSFFSGLSRSIVSISSKLNLALYSLNDRLIIALDRIYYGYGSGKRIKSGLVSSISKNGSGVSVELNDLGGVFNRVARIAPNDAPEYSSSTALDLVFNGFIVDDFTLTPDNTSETELGNNVIG
jgi:hypothetical protein